MSLDIKSLKELVSNLNENNVIHVDLKILGTKDFIRCGIIKISKPRSGLELLIERNKSSQISISEFQEYVEGVNEDDNIGYILNEPQFPIQRGSNISGFHIENNKLILTSILFPRSL